MVQLSHLYMTTGKTIALTIWAFVEFIGRFLLLGLNLGQFGRKGWHWEEELTCSREQWRQTETCRHPLPLLTSDSLQNTGMLLHFQLPNIMQKKKKRKERKERKEFVAKPNLIPYRERNCEILVWATKTAPNGYVQTHHIVYTKYTQF